MRQTYLPISLFILLIPSARAQDPDVRAKVAPLLSSSSLADLAAPFRYVPRSGPATNLTALRPSTSTSGGPTLATSIDVTAKLPNVNLTEGFELRITPREIETSAGTFGDPSRYIQPLAGVISDNDQRNDFLVRGGNPTENSFVIDNIEVPSINQLALSDTTGGFVSMLDAAAIQELRLHTDAYDSRFDQRLSSIIEISTRPTGDLVPHNITELGIAGIGGSSTRTLGNDGSLFFSARQSVLQYVTDDIGLNGVPVYRNAFVRAEKRIDDRNNWWGISLTGIDSIRMHPSPGDPVETSPYDTLYSGWRNTTGLNWQHLFSTRSFAIASIAHAEQSQSVAQTDQMQFNALIYNEHTRDGISTAKYDFTFQASPKVVLTAGLRASVDQLDYSIAQPLGLQNPYTSDPTPLDSSSMARRFATGSSAGYLQAVFTLPRSATLVLGERAEQWALGGHTGSTPKVLLTVPAFGRIFHVGYAEYEQLPATLFLLSFNNLANLQPIHSRQLTGGAILADNRHARLTLNLYRKQYTDYPVASGYPQLSLANIADTFGQAFLMFPMVARGTGLAEGAEFTAETRLTPRFDLTSTVTYARAWYSGLDGVLRRGNYDIPFTANFTGVYRMRHNLTLSGRYTTASGRPYTPDNMALSLAQDRDVYDLTQVNALRSGSYHRLDFRFEQTRPIAHGSMTWHIGLQNAFDNKNFYTHQWEPRVNASSEQDQMPIFPDGGLKYTF